MTEVEAQEENNEDFSRPISLGVKAHPITGEPGLSLQVGTDKPTWMPFIEIKGLTAQLDQIYLSSFVSTVVMNLLGQMSMAQEANQKRIIRP